MKSGVFQLSAGYSYRNINVISATKRDKVAADLLIETSICVDTKRIVSVYNKAAVQGEPCRAEIFTECY